MKLLLKNLLLQILQEFAQKTFTFDNLKLVRDKLLAGLKEQVESTETAIDDWAYSMIERMFANDNLKRIFDWVQKYGDAIFNPTICKVQKENSLGALAKEIDFAADSSCVVCAMPDTLKVIEILEIVIPFLYDWFKGSNKK